MIRKVIPAVMSVVLMAPQMAAGAAAPASSRLPPPPERPSLDENGVDVLTQQLTYSVPMLSIGPKDIGGLDYTIYYSGGVLRSSFDNLYEETMTGAGLHQSVSLGNSAASFDDGSYTNLGNPGDGSYLMPVDPGPYSGSGPISGGVRHVERDGTTTLYNQAIYEINHDDVYLVLAYAAYREFPNGTRQTFHYKTATVLGIPFPRLQSVTTNTGYQLKYSYATNVMPTDANTLANWREISSVTAINNTVEYCDPLADSCALSGAWRQMQYLSPMGQFRDADGKDTYFDSSSPSAIRIKTADSADYNRIYTRSLITLPLPNLPQLKIVAANIDGRSTSYAIGFSGVGGSLQTLTTTGPLSQHYVYKGYFGIPGVESVTDPLNRLRTYTYNAHRQLLTATAPEGNFTQFIINDGGDATRPQGNIVQTTAHPKSGSAALSEHWTFPTTCLDPNTNIEIKVKTCHSPLTHTDPNNRTTNYTYHEQSGGVETETAPAGGSGVQPVKRYAYVSRSAWIKNGAGSYVAATPIWLLETEKTCIRSATVGGTCADGPSDELVVAYDYGPNGGPNNLLLRGKVVTSNGVTLRTCYGYDAYGNKISETTPRAGLTSCP